MARCMLCSSAVGDSAVVCPFCGGAVEEDQDDATRLQGIDLTKVDGPPTAGPEWPGGPPGGFGPPTGPPLDAFGPPTGPPLDAPPPPGYGPPVGYGPPPGYGAAAGYGPSAGYGTPPGYGAPFGSGVPSGDGLSAGYGAPAGYGASPYLGGGGPPGAYGYGGWPGYVAPAPNEGMALAAFLTALLGLVTAPFAYVTILACPVGAILGHVALRRIAENGRSGRGMALAGVIIGWVGTALLVLGVAGIVFLLWAFASSGP